MTTSPETTIEQFCDQLAKEDADGYKSDALLEDQKGRDPSKHFFREKYGVSSDNRLFPLHYPEDIIGNNPGLYETRMQIVYRDFFTLPDETKAVIGYVKDGMCHSCVFGGGSGGLHCQTFATRAEYKFMESLKNSVDAYRALPAVKLAANENQGRFKISLEEIEHRPSVVWYPYGDETDKYSGIIVNKETLLITTTLGFLKDVLAYVASNKRFNSYLELLASRVSNNDQPNLSGDLSH